MIWTVFGVVFALLSLVSLVVGVMGIFNGEDYSYKGSVSYNNIGPFSMMIIYGVVAYIMFTLN